MPSIMHRKGHEGRGLALGFSEGQKDAIWARDKGLCAYCGDKAQQVDHIVPASKGGPSIVANGILACRPCNLQKYNRLSILWMTRAFLLLQERGEDIGWVDKLYRENLRRVRPSFFNCTVVSEIPQRRLPQKGGTAKGKAQDHVLSPVRRSISAKSSVAAISHQRMPNSFLAQPVIEKVSEIICMSCGDNFVPQWFRQRFCSGLCLSKLWYRTKLELFPTDFPPRIRQTAWRR